MSDRPTLAVGAALLLCAAPLTGQIPALRARADSLLSEWRQAQQFADLQDSLRLARERGRRDTIRAGALIYLVNRSPLPLAQAATIAWPRIERFYGPAAQEFARRPFLIEAIDPDTNEPASPGPAIRIPWNTDVPSLAQTLVGLADIGEFDAVMRDWLGGRVMAGFDSGPGHAAAYVQLATAPSRAAQRCFGGDHHACRDALSLSEITDPATQWYGPLERRAWVVEQYGDFLRRAGHGQAVRSCEEGSDESCLELLRSLGSLVPPLDYQARLTLLETAVRLGGAETFQRFLATPRGPMGRRLAAAARVSEDSLVGRWRSDVLAARPIPVSLPPWGPSVAIGWVLVFATCGARSSRWRVS